MKSKTVASIMRHVASKLPSVPTEGADGKEAKEGEESEVTGTSEEERLEQLYDQIAWPLGRKYGHPYDAFKLALTYVMPPLNNPLPPVHTTCTVSKTRSLHPSLHPSQRTSSPSSFLPSPAASRRSPSSFVLISSSPATLPQGSMLSRRRSEQERKRATRRFRSRRSSSRLHSTSCPPMQLTRYMLSKTDRYNADKPSSTLL